MKHYKFTFVLIFLFMIPIKTGAYEKKSSLNWLIENADFILTGRVVQINSKYELDYNKQRIFSYTRIKLESILKGDLNGDEIIVKTAGGKIGETIEFNSNSVGFKDNEEVLLFITKSSEKNSFFDIISISGKIKIIEKNGEKYYDSVMLRDFDPSVTIVDKDSIRVNEKSLDRVRYKKLSQIINKINELL